MVEPGRSAAAREANTKKSSTSTGAAMKKKLMSKKPEKEKDGSGGCRTTRKQSSHCREPESPSYRLALKSIFSCRNSQQQPDSGSRSSNKLGCSAPSICKLKDSDSSQRQRVAQRPAADETAGEPCKRRASVSGGSERRVKKPLSEVSSVSKQLQLQRGGSSLSSSSSSGGGSFRAGMQLRRLSGCYECHMVVDPVSGSGSGSSSMRATTVCPCPDCGEIFVRQESLQLHQSIRHAVSELGADDTSRNIIEIIFQSSWLKKQSPVCKVERILKVHNTARTLARFEEYRDAVKAKAAAQQQQQPAAKTTKHPRCTADGNELLRFHCATLACELGLNGATHLCSSSGGGGCGACAIIRDGFKINNAGDGGGVRTMATSGRAHDAVAGAPLDQEEEERRCRAMLVCRVIAGRVKRPTQLGEEEEASSEEFDSVAASAGVYSNLEELQVFNPRAILPCFVVVYKAAY
ncbi:hypothetical protein SEVIR_3G004800v4 [Setaria viridis]|uniref:C2H2-type domain-containing protein n=1 Tax=Setaria viridis TaxID=4556 RepID=A0A4U6V5P3_SETVI|nr:uncharacterized protein LOC117850258 [Setaria viridis]TKW23712.1 hypothetical protein SEVIR_3G004800v2 [Setaria viridis]